MFTDECGSEAEVELNTTLLLLMQRDVIWNLQVRSVKEAKLQGTFSEGLHDFGQK